MYKNKFNFLLIFVFSLIFLLSLASAELSLRINARLDYFNTDFVTITDSGAVTGYDAFDFIAPSSPGQYATLGSVVDGHVLGVDVWNPSVITRVFNLTFYTAPDSTGSMNLSWSFSGSNYDAVLVDYGSDSTYRTPLSSDIDLASDRGYNATVSGGYRYMQLTVVYHDFVRQTSNTEGSSGSSGESSSDNVETTCIESEECTDWNQCTNLESNFGTEFVSEGDYLIFKKDCFKQGLNVTTCGFQTRKCNITLSCDNQLVSPPQKGVCYYVENPTCFDNVKNCHDGKCEQETDCGGPCNKECVVGTKVKLSPNKFSELFKKATLFLKNNWLFIALVFLLGVLALMIIRTINILKRKKLESLSWYNLKNN